MDIFIDSDADVGLANQVYEAIRSGIVDGRLGDGDRLPPSRELAATLKVSRHTVTTAYDRLSAEGYVQGRRGGGTVVSDLFATTTPRSVELAPAPSSSTTGENPQMIYDLRAGTPDPRLFPAAEWKRCVRRAVDRHSAMYGDVAGTAALRTMLARWISRSRGVAADAGHIVVTSGAQQALYLLARSCVGSGDVVAVEDPGYLPVRRVAEVVGARVTSVPVDDEGIVVDAIPSTARLVYVTPSHQFPTGVTMSMGRRMALLSLAERRGMVIVEDDYDSEYRHVDRPLEPLFRLDRSGCVVYVATFSKILSPALRLGFAVMPPALLGEVLELRRLVDRAPSTVDQDTLCAFIADGMLDRHLRRARRIYQARYQRVSTWLGHVAERGIVGAPVSNAGLHASARLRGDRDEANLITRLTERGVALEGLGSYAIEASSGTGGFVVGFGRIGREPLGRALAVVEDVLTRN